MHKSSAFVQPASFVPCADAQNIRCIYIYIRFWPTLLLCLCRCTRAQHLFNQHSLSMSKFLCIDSTALKGVLFTWRPHPLLWHQTEVWGQLQRGSCIIRDQDPSKEDFKRIQRGSFQRGFGGELQRGLCIIRDQDSSKENPKRIQRGSFQRGFGGSCKEAFAPYMTRILPKVPDVCVSIFPTLAACDDVEQQTLTLTA